MSAAQDMRRAALVTGGSGGIGRAIARTLAEAGYGVTVASHRRRGIDAAVESLRADGLEATGVVADMAAEAGVVAMVEAHRAAWGRLDVLVNNAGVGMGQPLEKIQTKHLDQLLAVNIRGVVLATRQALPLLREAGTEHGRALIVNTASIAGLAGQPITSVYAATKAAVLNFSRSTQREVASEGIQCTALAPGFVDTRMTAFVKRHVPAGEMIQPQDLAEAVRFLLATSPTCHVPELVFTRPGPGPDSL